MWKLLCRDTRELMPFEGGKLFGCFCRSHIQFCEKCLKSRSSFYSLSEKKETGAKKLRQQLTLWRAITIWSSFTMYQSNEGKECSNRLRFVWWYFLQPRGKCKSGFINRIIFVTTKHGGQIPLTCIQGISLWLFTNF